MPRGKWVYIDDPNGECLPQIVPSRSTALYAQWEVEAYRKAVIRQETGAIDSGSDKGLSRLLNAIYRKG